MAGSLTAYRIPLSSRYSYTSGGADLSSSFFLPKIVGWGKAAEMCMTGVRVPADEAYRIGLANHVHTREDLLPAAKAMAAVMNGLG